MGRGMPQSVGHRVSAVGQIVTQLNRMAIGIELECRSALGIKTMG